MKEIDIQAIINILRGLNNSITISRLASDLPVSKSTLDRCNRDNRWPRALIISDVKNAINKYKDLYFDGQSELIGDELLNLLLIHDYPYEIYKKIYSESGYDAFLTELLNDAYINSQQPSEHMEKHIDSGKQDGDSNTQYVSVENKKINTQNPNSTLTMLSRDKFSNYLSTNWIYLFFWCILFIAVLLVMKLYNISIADTYSFLISINPVIFAVLSLFLAVSMVLAGKFIDTPSAIRKYEERTGKSVDRTDHEKVNYISLYGDERKIAYGEGRFNCNIQHMIFAAFCNITSCMWAISIFLYLNSLNGIRAILSAPSINICLSIILFLSILVTFIYNYFEQNISYPETIQPLRENPDTYIQNRANVIFNNLYLIFVLFFGFSSHVTVIYYTLFFDVSKTGGLDFSFILVVISAYLFLWFSSVSPYAVYFEATSAGNFVIIPPILVIFSLVYAISGFSFDHNMIVLIVLSIIMLLSWGIILYRQYSNKAHKNNKAYKSSMLASVIMIAIVLLIIFLEIIQI